MQRKQLAILMMIGALAVPLASHAADSGDRDRQAVKAWVKDSVITTKVKAQLAASKPTTLAMVHVDTDANGWVQLTGKVDSPSDKARAETLTRTVEGVKGVDNKLAVTGN